MSTTTILNYDGSFHGYMSALYQALQNPGQNFDIQREQTGQPSLFQQPGVVSQDTSNGRILWEAMQARSIGLPRLIYFAFLSEHQGVEILLLNYLRSIFCGISPGDEIRREWRRTLTQWARQVEMEKTTLENSLVLTPSRDRIPRCTIAPKHNVLPLLTRHFRTRFSGNPWIIYDSKRKFGLYGDSGQVDIFKAETSQVTAAGMRENSPASLNQTPFRSAV